MNKLLISTLAIAAATFGTQVMAQEADVAAMQAPAKAMSTLSRSVVQQQAAQALRDGTVIFGEAGLGTESKVGMALTRAQVQAELSEAIRLGLVGGGEVTPVASADDQARIVAAGLRAAATVVAAR
jgi:acyl CoA:acetate/3-ketoacid CoA transferase